MLPPCPEVLPPALMRPLLSGTLSFPAYSPEASTDLVPMSRAEALEALQETGHEMKGSLTSRTIADLVDWIKGINCYRMEVSSLSEAVSVIGGLLE